MPNIDYFLTTDNKITAVDLILKAKIKVGNKGSWRKDRLNALQLLLCNFVYHGHKENGIFHYDYSHRTVTPRYNPSAVGYRSLHWCIETLHEVDLIERVKAPPRIKDVPAPKLTSFFAVTPEAITFANVLGITQESVKELKRFHVVYKRLKPHNDYLEYPDTAYTMHIEMLMAAYCHQLNELTIEYDDSKKGHVVWGKNGEPIHLYRNYRAWTMSKGFHWVEDHMFLLDDCCSLGSGRSGGYWQNVWKEDRKPTLTINKKKTVEVDMPCSHTNLIYRYHTGRWYQRETNKELIEDGRATEDAYYVTGVHRDISKHVMQLVINCASKNGASQAFGKWIRQENDDEDKNATDEQVRLFEQSNLTVLEIINALLMRHRTIKDYLLKGRVAGQIIQWTEANFMFDLANYFSNIYCPTLTVHDSFIVEEEYGDMIQEFMFSTGLENEEIYQDFSQFNCIKHFPTAEQRKAIRAERKKKQ
jgi:hypothetical protein|tara:strand:+ start:172 stop:1593 length:1422 start_codon:yes stop_codon:yes gene_type:complete